MALIKKISIAKVIGNLKKMVAADEITEPTPVMRVFGVATGVKEGNSDNGPWVAVTGQFKAINLLSGEESASGVCFMPDVAIDSVVGQLRQDGINAVEFGYDIICRPSEDSAVGYEYDAEPLIKPNEDDAVTRLEAAIAKNAPALEAPKKETAKGKGKTAAA